MFNRLGILALLINMILWSDIFANDCSQQFQLKVGFYGADGRAFRGHGEIFIPEGPDTTKQFEIPVILEKAQLKQDVTVRGEVINFANGNASLVNIDVKSLIRMAHRLDRPALDLVVAVQVGPGHLAVAKDAMREIANKLNKYDRLSIIFLDAHGRIIRALKPTFMTSDAVQTVKNSVISAITEDATSTNGAIALEEAVGIEMDKMQMDRERTLGSQSRFILLTDLFQSNDHSPAQILAGHLGNLFKHQHVQTTLVNFGSGPAMANYLRAIPGGIYVDTNAEASMVDLFRNFDEKMISAVYGVEIGITNNGPKLADVTAVATSNGSFIASFPTRLQQDSLDGSDLYLIATITPSDAAAEVDDSFKAEVVILVEWRR